MFLFCTSARSRGLGLVAIRISLYIFQIEFSQVGAYQRVDWLDAASFSNVKHMRNFSGILDVRGTIQVVG
jgi:hypothetical protein